MYKSIYSKNFRWRAACETFPKTAKNVSSVYRTGIRCWKSEFNTIFNFSIVISTFRIIVSFPIKKAQGTCQN